MSPELEAAVGRLEAQANMPTHAKLARDGSLQEARYVELADLRLVLAAVKLSELERAVVLAGQVWWAASTPTARGDAQVMLRDSVGTLNAHLRTEPRP